MNNYGENNSNYRNGNRLVGRNPCPICGNVLLREGRNAHRPCRPCYNKSRRSGLLPIDIRKKYVAKYKISRKTIKDEIIEIYGGKCFTCELKYESCVFEFHHFDPTKKDKNPSSVFRQTDLSKIKKELINCMMVCCNCHRRIHWGSLKFDNKIMYKRVKEIWNNRASLSYS